MGERNIMNEEYALKARLYDLSCDLKELKETVLEIEKNYGQIILHEDMDRNRVSMMFDDVQTVYDVIENAYLRMKDQYFSEVTPGFKPGTLLWNNGKGPRPE